MLKTDHWFTSILKTLFLSLGKIHTKYLGRNYWKDVIERDELGSITGSSSKVHILKMVSGELGSVSILEMAVGVSSLKGVFYLMIERDKMP